MIRSEGTVQIFLVILALTLGVMAVIFAVFLWEYYRIVFVFLALMPIWYFMGKLFSRHITSIDTLREKEDENLALELAGLEERSTAFLQNNQQERENARQETLKGLAASINSLEEEIQGLNAEAELFDLKLLRSNTAHEIFEMKDIAEKMTALKKMQKEV